MSASNKVRVFNKFINVVTDTHAILIFWRGMMAQIDVSNIKKIEKERNSIHSKVFSTYTCFSEDGEKYFQIDTYGKPEREMPEKISQSVQFDKFAATYFVNILIKEFNLKVT